MKQKHLTSVLLTGGGIIPEADRHKLRKIDVGELFATGTTMLTIVNYIRNWVNKNRKF